MIDVEKLVFDYPTQRALFGVSVAIEPRTVTALVGPNGAGKSTLLRCLAALERPFSGRVKIDGVDTAKDPRGVHARVGFLPDFFGLYDELSARRCLSYAAMARGVTGSQVAIAADKAAERVGLSDRMNARAGELSRGLRQRLAIGQALVHEPRVLLLDEPSAGLDPEARRTLSDLIRSLAADGATLIVSSHILAELEDYCDQMVMMRDGRIVHDRAVPAVDPDAGRRVRVVFANPPADLAARLQALPDVAQALIEVNQDTAVLAARDGAGAGLLKSLVDAGLTVESFTQDTRALEQTYVREMAAADPGAGS